MGDQKDEDGRYHAAKLEHQQANRPFDVDVWYPLLATETMATELAALPEPTARALIAHYQHVYTGRAAPTAEQTQALAALAATIQDAVDRLGPLFVRLSSRSPKDAAVLDRALYERRAAYHCAHADRPADPVHLANAKMLALSEATAASMCVRSGADGLRLLCASERAFVDLLEAVEAHELYAMQIVMRAWDESLRADLEFRLFICGGRLTAISQYNHYVYYPYLPPLQAAIEHALVASWRDQVAPRLDGRAEYDSYVCDLAVYGVHGDYGADAAAGLTARVIELNSFLTSTGGALFSWTRDADVLHGRAPFEFRVHRAPLPHIADLVAHLEAEEANSLPGRHDPATAPAPPPAARRCTLM